MIKLTKKQLKQIIKEELSFLNEQSSPSELYDRFIYLRNEHQGELALLDRLGEKRYGEVIQIRDEMRADSSIEGYDAYKKFFNQVKQEYSLFPNTVRNLWDERHETPDITALKALKTEYDDLSSQFESRSGSNTSDYMYGRKRTEIVHAPTGEVVKTGLNRKGSLGT